MRACRRERESTAGPGAAGAAGQSDHDAAPLRETDLSVRRRDRAARVPGAVGEPVRAVGDGEPAAGGGGGGGGGVGPLPVRPRRAGSAGQRRGGGATRSGSGPAAVAGWSALVGLTAAVFTAPGFAVFTDLLAGWVLTPGRGTITWMLFVADPRGRRAHDAYHRFVRVGRWSMTALWRVLAVHAVAVFAPAGVVILDCDDTVYNKTGRAINGTGTFRDAVRSTRARVVYAWGLNLVIITLRVTPPGGGCPLGLPINMRVHHKGGRSTVELAAQMIREIADWPPGRQLHLYADGAYATLVGADLPRTVVTSRLRRDAALYQPAPPPHRQTRTPPHQGRPAAHPTRTRRRGHRLGRRRDRPAR